jgi:hypothetical protein
VKLRDLFMALINFEQNVFGQIFKTFVGQNFIKKLQTNSYLTLMDINNVIYFMASKGHIYVRKYFTLIKSCMFVNLCRN